MCVRVSEGLLPLTSLQWNLYACLSLAKWRAPDVRHFEEINTKFSSSGLHKSKICRSRRDVTRSPRPCSHCSPKSYISYVDFIYVIETRHKSALEEAGPGKINTTRTDYADGVTKVKKKKKKKEICFLASLGQNCQNFVGSDCTIS